MNESSFFLGPGTFPSGNTISSLRLELAEVPSRNWTHAIFPIPDDSPVTQYTDDLLWTSVDFIVLKYSLIMFTWYMEK